MTLISTYSSDSAWHEPTPPSKDASNAAWRLQSEASSLAGPNDITFMFRCGSSLSVGDFFHRMSRQGKNHLIALYLEGNVLGY